MDTDRNNVRINDCKASCEKGPYSVCDHESLRSVCASAQAAQSPYFHIQSMSPGESKKMKSEVCDCFVHTYSNSCGMQRLMNPFPTMQTISKTVPKRSLYTYAHRSLCKCTVWPGNMQPYI